MAKKEVPLDWRKLKRRKPEVWPELLILYGVKQARDRKKELGPKLRDALRGKVQVEVIGEGRVVARNVVAELPRPPSWCSSGARRRIYQ